MAARKKRASKKKKTSTDATHRLVLVNKQGTRKVLMRGTRAECRAAEKKCGKLGVCILEVIR